MLTIVFDLDGTLIDTAPDLIDALNFTLAGHALPTVPYAQARSLIGGGAWGMIERALILEGRTAATADVDTLYASFVAHYGHRFAVCTNKLERLSKRLLDALQLSDRFTAICGPDTFGIHKPDPQMFRATVLKAGGKPHRAVMVGDSITDIRTARAANVPVVAVDFGYTDVPVATLGPDRVISAFGELPAAIAALGPVKNVMDDQSFIRQQY